MAKTGRDIRTNCATQVLDKIPPTYIPPYVDISLYTLQPEKDTMIELRTWKPTLKDRYAICCCSRSTVSHLRDISICTKSSGSGVRIEREDGDCRDP